MLSKKRKYYAILRTYPKRGAVALRTANHAIEYKCPCCNAGLAFEDDLQRLTCEYCGNSFEIDTIRAFNESQNEQVKDDFSWEKDSTQEWSEEEQRLMAMHHPFTHPMDEDVHLLDSDPAAVRADAYDMVCNGVEVGGGSIRIHDPKLQAKMFEILGFTPEKAEEQFGFLMNAFKYGAPPHGGLAYGLDRWVSIFAGLDSIRDCIAFPKNNSGRDVMLDAPSFVDQKQLDEDFIALNLPKE